MPKQERKLKQFQSAVQAAPILGLYDQAEWKTKMNAKEQRSWTLPDSFPSTSLSHLFAVRSLSVLSSRSQARADHINKLLCSLAFVRIKQKESTGWDQKVGGRWGEEGYFLASFPDSLPWPGGVLYWRSLALSRLHPPPFLSLPLLLGDDSSATVNLFSSLFFVLPSHLLTFW